MTEPAIDERPVLWKPNSAPQTRFLATLAYEALYGGAAGGGKSEGLLIAPLRWVWHREFRALLMRRTFPELERSLIERSYKFYPAANGRPRNGGKEWIFPSGAKISFTHLEHESSVHAHQSAEYQFLGFDEQTHFTLKQYLYMLSRLRGPADLPVIARGATNPGGEGHEWVQDRWAPWLNRSPDYKGLRAVSGQTCHYILDESNREQYVNPKPLRSEVSGAHGRTLFRAWNGEEVWAPFDALKAAEAKAFARTFIGAKAADNPNVTADYAERLRALPPLERAQLRDGDWMARPAAGAYFREAWFKHLSVMPADAQIVGRVRRWDFAATEPNEENKDPDWTRGVKMAKLADGRFIVEDVRSVRTTPRGVESLVKDTAKDDGIETRIIVPQDPGSAGVVVVDRFVSLLAGYDIRGDRETGEKTTRAGPYSAQVEAGNVILLRAPWNYEYVHELQSFPEGSHDDMVDASSGAFNALQPASDEEVLESRLSTWRGAR